MLGLDLCSRLAGLLDHQVRGMLLDNAFNPRLLVSGNHDEARAVRGDPVVLCRSQFDLLDARVVRTLTVERKRLLNAVLLGALIDTVVDRAKHLFVVCCPVREIHRNIFAAVRRSGGERMLV
jgi:hypothetical protein